MKIYIENLQEQIRRQGGGFTFVRNLYNALKGKINFVNTLEECDIYFIFGVTTVEKATIYKAKELNKKIVLRVDNIPRRSRNKRMSPVERLTEFGNIADYVIYQSNWCKEYAGYFIDNKNNTIINNGYEPKIFNTKDRNSDGKTYLYINYNDNVFKQFDKAIYLFDIRWRYENDIKLIIAGNAPRVYIENPQFNWDLTGQGKVEYYGITNTPEETAKLMKRCDYILCPYYAEAYSNSLLEALACGLKPIGIEEEGGNIEMIEQWKNSNLLTIDDMAKKYLEIFKKII